EGRVTGFKEGRGGAPIQFDQVVISAGGEAGEHLRAALQLGSVVQFSQPIGHYPECKPENGGPLPDWAQAYASIGGAHTFLRDGEIYPHAEDVQRHPRTAVALNDNFIYFIVVDGRWPEVSVGMTIEELGAFARDELGAVWGIAQDGGGSSTMVINGVVVNNPSDVCFEHLVYLPAVFNLSEDAAEQEPAPPTFPPTNMTPDRCLRPVANGLMMVEVEPMAQSSQYAPGANVRTTDVVNLRTGPGTNYAILTELPQGSDGIVLDHTNGLNGVLATGFHWWRVEFNGAQGWIVENYLQPR
ncbi:MAG TPA: phosphodiester glycosidase family protein, partial [Anaerolineaceae bacterium]|nr:phosphodiester glycosidase family protein [Anaerolineaceae bacterium]